jgi:hypothetical protein
VNGFLWRVHICVQKVCILLKYSYLCTEFKSKQIIETIDKTREQIAALSADLSTVRDNVALIDMTTKQQVLELQGMKDRFKPFLAKPGLTEKLVNKDFTRSIHESQCLSGDKSKCVN